MSRWIKFFVVIILGLAVGLVYGWVINPVEYTNTAPDTLRADYRSDYVLMVAEVFHADQNIELAARRLALLGSEPPAQIASRAMEYALGVNYPTSDLNLLQKLTTSLQAWQPMPEGNLP